LRGKIMAVVFVRKLTEKREVVVERRLAGAAIQN
jgi:hypothetical protein